MKHQGVPVVKAVNRLVSMPYWPMYIDFIDHLNECDTCGPVMTPEGSQLVMDLCQEGRTRYGDYQNDLEQQTLKAAQN